MNNSNSPPPNPDSAIHEENPILQAVLKKFSETVVRSLDQLRIRPIDLSSASLSSIGVQHLIVPTLKAKLLPLTASVLHAPTLAQATIEPDYSGEIPSPYIADMAQPTNFAGMEPENAMQNEMMELDRLPQSIKEAWDWLRSGQSSEDRIEGAMFLIHSSIKPDSVSELLELGAHLHRVLVASYKKGCTNPDECLLVVALLDRLPDEVLAPVTVDLIEKIALVFASKPDDSGASEIVSAALRKFSTNRGHASLSRLVPYLTMKNQNSGLAAYYCVRLVLNATPLASTDGGLEDLKSVARTRCFGFFEGAHSDAQALASCCTSYVACVLLGVEGLDALTDKMRELYDPGLGALLVEPLDLTLESWRALFAAQPSEMLAEQIKKVASVRTQLLDGNSLPFLPLQQFMRR